MKVLLFFFITFSICAKTIGLQEGALAPNIKLTDTEGKSFDLYKQKKKTILVFYRGAWCPYCVKQLKAINEEVIGKVNSKGAQLIAISVDRPAVAKKMKRDFKLDFKVLSDSKAKSLKSYKIINQVGPDLVKKYKSSYKIDIEADSGETHHMIAHPAVFIVKDKKVTFSDIHENYKERTKHIVLLKALNK